MPDPSLTVTTTDVVSASARERVLAKTLTFTVQPTPDEPAPVAPALVLLPAPELQAASPTAKRIQIIPRTISGTVRGFPGAIPGPPFGKSCFGTAFIISGTMPIPSIRLVDSMIFLSNVQPVFCGLNRGL